MGLAVWLPLNGNINNYGYGTITTTGTSSFSTGGKIGQCLTSSGGFNVHYTALAGSKVWSFCFWGYVISANITANWTRLIQILDGGSNLRVEVCPSSYQNGIYCYSTHNNSTYNITSGSTHAPNGGYYDQWHHFAITSDGITISVYDNGILRGTCAYDGSGSITGVVYIENSDKIKKNDFRIYDHCLSPKEVKEISKCLVMHYPLDNNGIGNPNLVPNQGAYYSESTAYVRTSPSKDGNAWLSGSHFIVEPSTTYTFSVYSDGNLAASHNTGGTDSSLKAFTMWLYLCNSDTTKNPDAGGYDNPVCFTSTNYNHQQNGNRHIWQYTTKSTETHMSVRVNNYSDGTNNLTIKYWQIKIEKGSNASPWCPHTSDAIYSTFNINGTTEFDTSGYKNNGTRSGSLSASSDTPRYSCSTYFPSGTGIFANPNMTFSEYTISFWGKHSALGKMLMGSNASTSSLNNSWYWYGDKSFKYPSGEFYYQHNAGSEEALLGTWTHFVATYDGSYVRIYRNGVAEGSKAASGTMTLKYVSVGIGFTSSSYWENGYVSDFRLYATALSDADILELYNTGASIDNGGNVLTYDIQEK